MVLRAYVSSTDLGVFAGYIYLIFVPSLPVAYVGQTRSTYGAIGRFTQHISRTDSNTFLQRVSAILKLEDVVLRDVNFYACRLPNENRFHGASSEYREAIEGSVQISLLRRFEVENVRAPLVSRVRLNAYSSQSDISHIADEIAGELVLAVKKDLA